MTFYVDIYNRSHSHSYDFILHFPNGRGMEETGARSLCPKSLYKQMFLVVTDDPVLAYPVVLFFEFTGIIMSHDE